MKINSLLLAGVALTFAFQFGCAPAVPPAAPDTRAADEQAIRDSESAWGKEFAAKDVDKVTAHYQDDASSMMPDMKLVAGKGAIGAAMKDQFSDPKFALDIHTAKVEVAKGSDMAYSQGTYTYTGTDPKTKKVMTETGNYVEVYKKQADGSWKVVEDIASDDALPMPAKATK